MLEIFGGLLLINLASLVPPGPYTFVIIQYGRNKSGRSAMLFITGSFIADLLLVLLLYFGLTPFLKNPLVGSFSSIVGGIFLSWLGIQILKNNNVSQLKANDNFLNKGPLMTGFLVAIMHPAYWIWWGTIGVSYLTQALKFSVIGIGAFLTALILPTYGWFGFLYLAIAKGRKWISDKVFYKINIICGISLIGFSFWFLGKGLFSLFSWY